jgi:hypothetical protein
MAVRQEVQRLLALGRMPSDQDEVPEATVKAFQDALDDLQPHQLSDDEAVALLDMFPAGEYSGLFELEWSLLHAIESAPYGPDFLAHLDDRSWWAPLLRKLL